MILINGQPENRIDVADRGLQYGDGVFETIAYRQGHLEFLDAHLARLQRGCERLNIPFTEYPALQAELDDVCKQLSNDAVIKIIVTRGSGGRGYRTADPMTPTRIVSTHPLPIYPVQNTHGVTVRLCQHRLGVNPALAGIKHLNRLEQILARSEWQEADIAEGLMRDFDDNLVEGTMSNLFLVKSDQILTPSVLNNGVAGIMREQVINLARQLNIELIETTLQESDLLQADEVFITNSVIGIWPVTQLVAPAHQWRYGTVTKRLQQSLNEWKANQ